MDAPAVKDAERVIELPAESFSRRENREPPALVPSASVTPLQLLNIAVSKGTDLAQLEKLMDLQERWEREEARKAFNTAFAAFKAEAVKIIKNRAVDAGPLAGKKYAELFTVVNALTPALSANGLSASWKLTKDEKEWIEVTCILTHTLGHSESVSMGGPPDTGGAKSAIQARASTVSYLERYTLKAVCGVSEQDDDRDGNTPPAPKDTGPKPYADADFETNLPKWTALVKSGKKTAEQIISTVSSKAVLSEPQKQAILAIKRAPEQPPITFAVVAERLQKATDPDILDAEADLIRSIADAQQREELTVIYCKRQAELEVTR